MRVEILESEKRKLPCHGFCVLLCRYPGSSHIAAQTPTGGSSPIVHAVRLTGLPPRFSLLEHCISKIALFGKEQRFSTCSPHDLHNAIVEPPFEWPFPATTVVNISSRYHPNHPRTHIPCTPSPTRQLVVSALLPAPGIPYGIRTITYSIFTCVHVVVRAITVSSVFRLCF